MEIEQSDDGITLSQTKYANKVLQKYGMSDCRPVATPLEPQNQNETSKVKPKQQTQFPYREAVGSLQYLSCKTRPDLAYAVNYANRFVENPTDLDVQNVKRILRYLKGTLETGIKFSTGDKMIGYCDSDYAGSGERGH
jgi:hypothetical protein